MNQKRIYISAGIAGIFVLLLFSWFIHIGPWRARGYTSDYYAQQASAFRHGQVALETKPDPALLALPNIYDPKARKNIPLLGDASVYEGKYYLYFGPLPSILLALITLLFPIQLGDQIFVYIFTIGLFLFQSLLFIEIVCRYFRNLPDWLIPLGVMFLGVVGPFLRMLAHPLIHEAAISGGQLFATMGMYLAFMALKDHSISSRKLFLAGCFWAFAIATRATQLIPIGLMTGVTLFFLLYKSRNEMDGSFGFATLSFLSPLVIGGLLLAWYNWIRFDSIFEFGLYYQLAAFDLQQNYSILFSRIYLIQNIFNYFINPFEVRSVFPFLFPAAGRETPVFLSPELPKLYIVEEAKFPGLLSSTPFLIFAILPILFLAGRTFHKVRSNNETENRFSHFDWNVLNLTASWIGGSIPILLLFYAGIRYETEFVTSLGMLAFIGFCQIYQIPGRSSLRRALTIFSLTILVFSIIANVVLAYTGLMA